MGSCHTIAEELLALSRDAFGTDLRVVTRYNANEHEPIYTREDVPDELELDEEARSGFRRPLVRMQKSAHDLAYFHPHLTEPEFAIHSYEDIIVLQIPLSEKDGIIITLDVVEGLPTDLMARCKAIVERSQ